MKNSQIEWSDAIQEEKEAKAREEAYQVDFQKRLDEAKCDVEDRIYNCDEPFSYSDIEEIMDSHGIEMDYIEEFLI